MGATGAEVARRTRRAACRRGIRLRAVAALGRFGFRSRLRSRPALPRAVRGAGALAALLLARAALARLGGSLLGTLLLLGAALLLLGELAGGRCQLGVAAGIGPRGALGCGLGGLFQVEARDLNLGDVALDELLDGRQLVFVLGADEGDREAFGSGAARAADAVHVVLGLGGHVVVHHIGHFVDVDAAGQHVGGHEDVGLAGGEVVQGALALVLGAVGMDGLGVVAGSL